MSISSYFQFVLPELSSHADESDFQINRRSKAMFLLNESNL